MSDEVKKDESQNEAAQNPARELSPEELNLVSGSGVEIFFTVDGITGESTKSGAEGWIEIASGVRSPEPLK